MENNGAGMTFTNIKCYVKPVVFVNGMADIITDLVNHETKTLPSRKF